MPKQDLLVALIAGPMYDRLYQALTEFTRAIWLRVEIAFHGAHPELNAHLASRDQCRCGATRHGNPDSRVAQAA